jgi:hypothetical protein
MIDTKVDYVSISSEPSRRLKSIRLQTYLRWSWCAFEIDKTKGLSVMHRAHKAILRINRACQSQRPSARTSVARSWLASQRIVFYSDERLQAHHEEVGCLRRIVKRCCAHGGLTTLVLLASVEFDTTKVLLWIDALRMLQMEGVASGTQMTFNEAGNKYELCIVGPTDEIDEIQIGIGSQAVSHGSNNQIKMSCSAMQHSDAYSKLSSATKARCVRAWVQTKLAAPLSPNVITYEHSTDSTALTAMLRSRMWCPSVDQGSFVTAEKKRRGYPGKMTSDQVAALVVASFSHVKESDYDHFATCVARSRKLSRTASRLRKMYLQRDFSHMPHGWQGTGELASHLQNLAPHITPTIGQLRAIYDIWLSECSSDANPSQLLVKFVCNNADEEHKLQANLKRAPPRKIAIKRIAQNVQTLEAKNHHCPKSDWLDALCSSVLSIKEDNL